MRVWAVYRALYGEDWIGASIRSIRDSVERIFLFHATRPWGRVSEVDYRGLKIPIPARIDRVVEMAWSEYPDIDLYEFDCDTPVNQFTAMVNEVVLDRPTAGWPDLIMIIEHDQIFAAAELEKALDDAPSHRCCKTFQHEIWMPPHATEPYVVTPQRCNRTGVVFWRMKEGKLPQTKHQGEPARGMLPHIESTVHNMGFAVSKSGMFWKHVVGLGISRVIGDSLPDEDWMEDRWLGWTPEMENLEISKRHKSSIRKSIPYPAEELPEMLRTPIRSAS